MMNSNMNNMGLYDMNMTNCINNMRIYNMNDNKSDKMSYKIIFFNSNNYYITF